MFKVLHLIDEKTPTDCLDQLNLLAGPGNQVVSLGRPPGHAGLTLPVKAVHRPLGSAALAGWRLCNQVGGVAILHAWSPAGLRAGQAVRERSPARAPRLLLSIPCAPASSRALERLVQDIRQGCFHLTVPTHAARQSMIAAGAPAEAVHVLPPPAPPIDQLQRRRARVRAELGLSDSEQLIVAPSEMTRYAGHKYASWAHAILRQVLPGPRLLLPGGGPCEGHVRFFAATTGYDPEVFFTGDRFSRDDVLAAADVAVFFQEKNSGVAALTAAMAAGVPIAASAVPDISEIAPHDDAALLVEPADPRQATAAVLHIVEDAHLGKRLAAAAKERAARYFSLDAGLKTLEAIYAAVGSGGVR